MKKCSRCRGYLFADLDGRTCVNCGHVEEMALPSQLQVPPALVYVPRPGAVRSAVRVYPEDWWR